MDSVLRCRKKKKGGKEWKINEPEETNRIKIASTVVTVSKDWFKYDRKY